MICSQQGRNATREQVDLVLLQPELLELVVLLRLFLVLLGAQNGLNQWLLLSML